MINTTIQKYKELDFFYSYNLNDPSGKGCIYEIIQCDNYKLYKYKNLTTNIIDIGGNNGLATIILALQNPNSKIYVLEPLPRLIEIITKNVKDNNLNNVTIINKALGDGKNTSIFIPNSCSGASSTIVQNSSTFSKIQRGLKNVIENVQTTTFDDLIKEYNIDDIQVLKIDCEGGEYYLFESQYIKNKIVKNIVGEFHDLSYNKNKNKNWNSKNLTDYIKNYVNGDINITYLKL